MGRKSGVQEWGARLGHKNRAREKGARVGWPDLGSLVLALENLESFGAQRASL